METEVTNSLFCSTLIALHVVVTLYQLKIFEELFILIILSPCQPGELLMLAHSYVGFVYY